MRRARAQPAAPMETKREDEVLRAGELEVRPADHVALVGGRALPLSVRELELLAALCAGRGKVVPREELYSTVWGAPLRRRRPLRRRVHPQAACQAGPRSSRSTATCTPTSASDTGSSRSFHIPFTREWTTDNRMGCNEEEGTCRRSPSRGSLAFGVAACGEDEESSGSAASERRPTAAVRSAARSRSTVRRPWRRSPRPRPSCSTRRIPTCRSRSGRPGPAAASRSSAPARPTSPTRVASDQGGGRGPRLREGRRQVHRDRRWPTTASPSPRTRTWPSTA